MSYNYLPLDRKWLSFQQVKNLLDFDQLVSITFEAHESVLACRSYLELNASGLKEQHSVDVLNDQLQYDELSVNRPLFEEVPVEVVKLMLMLKIKSLSYGYSGVKIETVKRLLDMFNNKVLPIIFNSNQPASEVSLTPMRQLGLAAAGFGGARYPDDWQTRTTAVQSSVWQPSDIEGREHLVLGSGTQFITACGLHALRQAEQLIGIGNFIAALSFDVAGCSPQLLAKKLHALSKHAGQEKTATTIRAYLGESSTGTGPGQEIVADPVFYGIMAVHGAVQDTYEHVLALFLQEINSVSETFIVLREENLILTGVDHGREETLLTALQTLTLALEEMAVASQRREHELATHGTAYRQPHDESRATGTGVISGQPVLGPAVAQHKSGPIVSRCLAVVGHTFKVLADELITAVDLLESKASHPTAAIFDQAMADFRKIIAEYQTRGVKQVKKIAAEHFVKTYKPAKPGA